MRSNDHDLDKVAKFVTEDLFFDWGDVMAPLAGRDACFAFYTTAWRHFDERLTATDPRFESDGALSAHISNTIVVHRDWVDCPIEPVYAGSTFTVTGRMLYRFDGLRICHIVEEPPPTAYPATGTPTG